MKRFVRFAPAVMMAALIIIGGSATTCSAEEGLRISPLPQRCGYIIRIPHEQAVKLQKALNGNINEEALRLVLHGSLQLAQALDIEPSSRLALVAGEIVGEMTIRNLAEFKARLNENIGRRGVRIIVEESPVLGEFLGATEYTQHIWWVTSPRCWFGNAADAAERLGLAKIADGDREQIEVYLALLHTPASVLVSSSSWRMKRRD